MEERDADDGFGGEQKNVVLMMGVECDMRAISAGGFNVLVEPLFDTFHLQRHQSCLRVLAPNPR
jgi:hypothetical protein